MSLAVVPFTPKGWDVVRPGTSFTCNALVITHILWERKQMAQAEAQAPLRPVYGPSPREAGLSLGVYAEVAVRTLPPCSLFLFEPASAGD